MRYALFDRAEFIWRMLFKTLYKTVASSLTLSFDINMLATPSVMYSNASKNYWSKNIFSA